jgi:DNA-binding transcriptional LysR family regulator
MSKIDISSIDLNLLRSLEVLLTEQSVTAAARRAGVTQSSMSHTLGRLRELFQDPLLVRAGRGVVSTPRGESLLVPIQRLLVEVGALVNGEPEFIAATSSREFVLACPDLLSRLSFLAPKVRLEVRPLPVSELEVSLGGAAYDLALVPGPCEGAGLRQRSLGRLSWCVLARRDHPALSGHFTAKVWGCYPHVIVRSGRSTPNRVEQALATEKIDREVGLVVPSFLLALYAVAYTDFFLTAPRELVSRLALPLGLAVLTPPIKIPAVEVLSVWHERLHTDPGNRWFRHVIAEVWLRLEETSEVS